jgi:DNA-binding MarR family transcriptional regulator
MGERVGVPVGDPPSVAFLVSRLGFQVSADLAGALTPLGIEPRHFGLLRVLAASEGQTQRAIGQALGLHPNRVVSLVDELEQQDLVHRGRHPSDRRAHALSLTGKGRRVLNDAFQAAFSIEEELCADLQPAERDQLLDLLARLRPTGSGHPGP